MKLEGVYVALATPFLGDGSLDQKGFERLVGRCLEAGVHGLVPCGTTGETPTLKPEEVKWLVEASVRLARPRGVKVVAGCGSNSTATTVALTRQAKEWGADGALVVSPYYNKPTPAGLENHFTTVAREGGLPVVLYNVPGRTGVSLSPSLVTKLLGVPGIVGIKEASGQFSQWLAIAHGFDLRKTSLLAGDDDSFAPVLALGGTGIISASANVAPGMFVSLYEAHKKGDWPTAWALQRDLFPLVQAMFAESNPGPVKHALSLLGICADVLRAPLVPVGEATARQIAAVVKGGGIR